MNIVNANIELSVIDFAGKEIDKTKLSSLFFGVEPNEEAVQLAVKVDLANRRQATAKTKTISEVSGTGKKPWRQKGTGRARAGSLRSPVFVGGATCFGPTGVQNFKLKMNKNVAFIAIASALSDKVANNNLVAITDEKFASCKTKDFAKALESMKLEGKLLIVLNEYDENLVRAASNLPNVIIVSTDNVSVYDVLNANKVVMTKSALEAYNFEEEYEEECTCGCCSEEESK